MTLSIAMATVFTIIGLVIAFFPLACILFWERFIRGPYVNYDIGIDTLIYLLGSFAWAMIVLTVIVVAWLVS